MQRGGGVRRLGRLPLPLELPERSREASGEAVRDVVIPRNGQDRPVERAEKSGRAGELAFAAAVAEVSARDHKFRLEALDQDRRAALDCSVVSRAVVKVREV